MCVCVFEGRRNRSHLLASRATTECNRRAHIESTILGAPAVDASASLGRQPQMDCVAYTPGQVPNANGAGTRWDVSGGLGGRLAAHHMTTLSGLFLVRLKYSHANKMESVCLFSLFIFNCVPSFGLFLEISRPQDTSHKPATCLPPSREGRRGAPSFGQFCTCCRDTRKQAMSNTDFGWGLAWSGLVWSGLVWNDKSLHRRNSHSMSSIWSRHLKYEPFRPVPV